MKIHWCLILIISCGGRCNKSSSAPTPPPEPPDSKLFTNPLIDGSDPWVIKNDSVYYYLHTLGSRIAIWKTKEISELNTSQTTTVFNPTSGQPNSANIWAPELHRLNNKWYIYFTAGAGPDSTQRLWVLENESADPTAGAWTNKGRLFNDNADFWAIDGTIMSYSGTNYFVWSGRPNLSMQNQNIYISKMTNPWTLEGAVTTLTKPELPWETSGSVNEAPQVLEHNGNLFLVYSASGCWTDDYCLGMLSLKTNGDPLMIDDWTKNQQPVFVKNPANNAYAPGHNAFFKSVDNQEDWIIYHANTNSGDGCGTKRNIRAQRFTWSNDGRPIFGEPVKTGEEISVPGGE